MSDAVTEMLSTDEEQDWGLKFPPEKIEEMKGRTELKRLATVEVSRRLPPYATLPDTHADVAKQDVAEQVLCFARSRSVTGVNAVIDGGMAL